MPWLALALIALPFAGARAESRLVFSLPVGADAVDATTFDDHGRAVGHSSFALEASEAGTQRMRIELAVADGGVNRSEALLTPLDEPATDEEQDEGTKRFRLLEQRAQATRADGVALELLVIDHARARVSCYDSDGDPESERRLALPMRDSVVNVPLQLLFQPLATGEAEEVRFQLAMCRGGPRLQDMVATRGPRLDRHGREVIEIHYGPDFGNAMAWLTTRVLPRFSFWFDPRGGRYLGHRMPLYRKGPDITLVRQGLTLPDLGIGAD